MARQRDYAAEYQARQERAIERGYSSYREERAVRQELASTVKAELENVGGSIYGAGGYNARQLAAHYNAFTALDIGARDIEDREEWGAWMHDMVMYFMDYEGMTQQEAVDAAYEIAAG